MIVFNAMCNVHTLTVTYIRLVVELSSSVNSSNLRGRLESKHTYLYSFISFPVTPPEKAPSKGTPVLLPIILGSVIGVVFLVLFVLVIILILKKIRKNRSTDSSADVSDTTRPIDGDWRRTDRMFWQGTGEGMRSLPRVNRMEYARMKANSKAMEPFTTVSVTAG